MDAGTDQYVSQCPQTHETTQFEDFVFYTQDVMTMSQFLDCFRVHLPTISSKVSLKTHDLVSLYDKVFRKKLILYSKFSKLPNGEPISSQVVEADIKLSQDYRKQVIEPVLRKELQSIVSEILGEVLDIGCKIDEENNFHQFSALASVGDCGTAIKNVLLKLFSILNTIFMIETYRGEIPQQTRLLSFSNWFGNTFNNGKDIEPLQNSEKIWSNFLKSIIKKHFEVSWFNEVLKAQVPKGWAHTELLQGFMAMLIEDVLTVAMCFQPRLVIGMVRNVVKPLTFSERFKAYMGCVGASNPDFDGAIPNLLRQVSVGISSCLQSLPKTVLPQLEECESSLLSILENIKHGRWNDCKVTYIEFRRSLENTDTQVQTLTEHFESEFVYKESHVDPDWVVVDNKLPVQSEHKLHDILSSKLY